MISISSHSGRLLDGTYLWIEALQYNDKGLIPVIIQDARDRTILRLLWMDKEKVHQAFSSGFMLEAGTSYKIEVIFYDCDRDVLLFEIERNNGSNMTLETNFHAVPSPDLDHNPGGIVEKYQWKWQDSTYEVAYEILGQGSPVLLLPAFSTVSTRAEMRGIAQKLAAQYQTIALDWLGFGESDRPALDYQPAIYLQLLRDFARSHFNQPIPVIGAGHAAGYIMQLANESPTTWSKIVLIAPTWRGPLPTAMGEHRSQYGILRSLVRSPVLGQFLYNLTTTPSFLSMMYRRHVYIQLERVTPELIRQKRQTTQQPGARFASAAFVTGNLDIVLNREDFLQLFQTISVPTAIAIGEQTPPKSKAEMEAIATMPNIRVFQMQGALGMHEEYSDVLATTIQGIV